MHVYGTSLLHSDPANDKGNSAIDVLRASIVATTALILRLLSTLAFNLFRKMQLFPSNPSLQHNSENAGKACPAAIEDGCLGR